MRRQVRQPREAISKVVGLGLDLLGPEFGEVSLGGGDVRPQLLDPLIDGVSVQPVLERLDLHLDPSLSVSDELAQARADVTLTAPTITLGALELLGELVEPHGTKDPLVEESGNHGGEGVLTEVDPLLSGVGLASCGVAVGRPVRAGVVVVGLSGLARHGERLVAGCAVHHPCEQIPALADARCLPIRSKLEPGLAGREGLFGDERRVCLLADHPLFLGTQAGASAAVFTGGAEVESVPDLTPRINRVAQHGAYGGCRPMPADVAFRVDVPRGGRTAPPVEVVSDRRRAVATVGMQVEDLRDDWRLLRVRLKPDAMLAAVTLVSDGHRLESSAVAVWGSTAHAKSLFGGLTHAALRLARELVALELVEELLHADHHTTFRGAGVATTCRVVDWDSDLPQFALEEHGVDAVA